MLEVELPNWLVVNIMEIICYFIPTHILPSFVKENLDPNDDTVYVKEWISTLDNSKFENRKPFRFKTASVLSEMLKDIKGLNGSKRPLLIMHDPDDKVTNFIGSEK